jgi:hypothetical protein
VHGPADARSLQRSLDAAKAVLAVRRPVAPSVALDVLARPHVDALGNPAQARSDVLGARRARAPTRRGAISTSRGSERSRRSSSPARRRGRREHAVDVGEVEQQALQALERGDASALQGLARRCSAAGRGLDVERRRCARPRGDRRPGTLGKPFPGSWRGRSRSASNS